MIKTLKNKSKQEEERFLGHIKELGMDSFVRKPLDYAERKQNVAESLNQYHISQKERYPLWSLYKECATKSFAKVHPTILSSLKYYDSLSFDMDCLKDRQEIPVYRFIEKATTLHKIRAWSCLAKLEDVDYMMKEENMAYSEYVKSAVRQFYIKI